MNSSPSYAVGAISRILKTLEILQTKTPRTLCSLTSVFGEAPINCSSASSPPPRQTQTFSLNKLFIRAVEAHQWGCNCLEGASHASSSCMCLTDDLIDRLWRNQTKFHSCLSRTHQILLQNCHELSLYNIQIMSMSILAN